MGPADYSDGLWADQQQKVVFETGSFSGYRPVVAELGSGYLSAESFSKQPLCGNEEGWGPLSPFRYDFTPCFIDVWVASVAAFGIFVGAIAVWWLLKRKQPTPVSKDWHFWTKQVGCASDHLCVDGALTLHPDPPRPHHRRLCRPARLSDSQLPRHLVRRLPSLHHRGHDCLPFRRFYHPMARALPPS